MQSPPIEWSLSIGHLLVLNLLRDRGEPDKDTISENVRPWARRHPAAFTTLCVAAPVWFWRHIDPTGRFRPDV